MFVGGSESKRIHLRALIANFFLLLIKLWWLLCLSGQRNSAAAVDCERCWNTFTFAPMRNGEEPFARHTATHKLSQTRLSDIFLDDFRQLCRFVLFFFAFSNRTSNRYSHSIWSVFMNWFDLSGSSEFIVRIWSDYGGWLNADWLNSSNRIGWDLASPMRAPRFPRSSLIVPSFTGFYSTFSGLNRALPSLTRFSYLPPTFRVHWITRRIWRAVRIRF